MNCNKCGYLLPYGSNVCSYCGTVNDAAVQDQTQQQPNPAPPPQPNQQQPVYNQPKRKLKQCRFCKQMIDKKAKFCPYCTKRQGESCLSATVFILLVLGFFCFFGNKIINGDEPSESYQTSDRAVVSNDTNNDSSDGLTLSQKNALKQAKNYLSFTSFSAKGLVEQLEFEGYPHDDAVFAVSNCGADWNEQAYQKAVSYLSMTAFSRQGLIEQLEFEGFTSEQAEYALQKLGY